MGGHNGRMRFPGGNGRGVPNIPNLPGPAPGQRIQIQLQIAGPLQGAILDTLWRAVFDTVELRAAALTPIRDFMDQIVDAQIEDLKARPELAGAVIDGTLGRLRQQGKNAAENMIDRLEFAEPENDEG